jgi:hypothetical protein
MEILLACLSGIPGAQEFPNKQQKRKHEKIRANPGLFPLETFG